MTRFLDDGPAEARHVVLLAHGAGAGMETRFLVEMAGLLAERGLRVLRFEFGYMAARRTGGKRRPPPKADTLTGEYAAAIDAARSHLGWTGKAKGEAGQRLLIGGKSMGGRVASMVADEMFNAGQAAGLVCLGYPFHPPGKPEATRTAHLEGLAAPALIVQGERDPFGTRAEVESYTLSKAIRIAWIDDGDHDLGPRGGSGFTRKGNLAAAASAVAAFAAALSSER